VNTTSAMERGNHPPWTTLRRLADRKARSTKRKLAAPKSTSHNGFLHCVRTTTKKRTVSMAKVPVTAIP